MSTTDRTCTDQTWKPGEPAAAVRAGVTRENYAAACERGFIGKRGRTRWDVALGVWLAAAQSWERAAQSAQEAP